MSEFFSRHLPAPNEDLRALDLKARLAGPRADVLHKAAELSHAAAYLVGALNEKEVNPDISLTDNNVYLSRSWYGRERQQLSRTVVNSGWLLRTAVHSTTDYGKYQAAPPDQKLALCLTQDGTFVNGVYRDDHGVKYVRTLDMTNPGIFDSIGVQGLMCLYERTRWVHEQDKISYTATALAFLEDSLLMTGKRLLSWRK